MADRSKDAAHDDTLAASTPGTEETLISGGGPTPIPPPRAASSGIRAGRPEDYTDLAPVDPQHYVVGKELARGGMGRIMAARDRRLGRPVAIKELLVKSPELRARFEREARITAKLQDPGIVNVMEAGAWPTGEPFYVMKLVTGESLDKVIAARATLQERLGLLPNVIAVADALAYAHNMRVIHRDLKPANVLVGEFGETVVIDWGLAKDLTDQSAPEMTVGPYRSVPDAHGDTVAGAVMGTPAYMPVEQARGAAVDERADVYALGAMLYHVLAGGAPYAGRTTNELLDAVIAGPPPPLATRVAGAPPDLVTIVNKAMARGADDRYPTAKGLADDLKKFQTGQLVSAHRYSSLQLVQRWIRRHRTAVAVACVAVVLLAALGVVSVRRIVRAQAQTERQRRVAEETRGEAEDLLSFMLGDLRDKLEPLGKLELLDEVATKAVAYYDRRGEDLSDAELARRAGAQRNLGDVLSAQGRPEVALRQYRASLAIAETLATRHADDAHRQRDLSVSHERVGDALLAQGDSARALAEYRAELALDEALAAREPANRAWRRDLSISHEKVGDALFAQGDTVAALAAYRAELAVDETLAANDPTDHDRQRLAWSRSKVAGQLLAQGDAAGALAQGREEKIILEALVAKDPENAQRQRDLADAHSTIGDALSAQGEKQAALAEYRASLAIRDTLAAKDPTNADRQRDLAVSHAMVGDVLAAQGDKAAALAEYRASLASFETLAARDLTAADRQRDLAIGHNKVGDALLAQGDVGGALVEYRSELAIFEALAAKEPDSEGRQPDLAAGHEKVGDVLLAQGNAAAALAEYRAELAIFDGLAAKDPTSADLQIALAESHRDVGNALLAQKDAAGALTEYRAYRAGAEPIAAKDPTNADRQVDLASSREKIGDGLLAQGDAAGASVEYAASLAIFEALAAKDASNADRQADRARLARKVSGSATDRGSRR